MKKIILLISHLDIQIAEPVDEEFKTKITEGYEDCHALSKAVPQSILDKNPLTKRFGKHMVFFKCSKVRKYRMSKCH